MRVRLRMPVGCQLDGKRERTQEARLTEERETFFRRGRVHRGVRFGREDLERAAQAIGLGQLSYSKSKTRTSSSLTRGLPD